MDEKDYLEQLQRAHVKQYKTEVLLEEAENELQEIIYSLQEKLEEMRYKHKTEMGKR